MAMAGEDDGWVADLRRAGFVTLRGVVPPEVLAKLRAQVSAELTTTLFSKS